MSLQGLNPVLTRDPCSGQTMEAPSILDLQRGNRGAEDGERRRLAGRSRRHDASPERLRTHQSLVFWILLRMFYGRTKEELLHVLFGYLSSASRYQDTSIIYPD